MKSFLKKFKESKGCLNPENKERTQKNRGIKQEEEKEDNLQEEEEGVDVVDSNKDKDQGQGQGQDHSVRWIRKLNNKCCTNM